MNTLDPASLHLAAIVQSSDDAIISTTIGGVIETWNPPAERMFGYAPAEAIGRSIDLILPEPQRGAERLLAARVEGGEGVTHYETIGLTRSGESLSLSMSMSPVLTPDGEVLGIARIARDLTAQRGLERQALRLGAIVNSSDDASLSKELTGN